MPILRLIGPGRAGLSLSRVLAAAGWSCLEPLGRDDDVTAAAHRADLVMIATPDAAVADVAAAIAPSAAAVVAHMAGSLGLEVLAPHDRRAALHPLRSIPTPDTPLTGAWWAVAGDALADDVVATLEGHAVTVTDDDRAAYHAAAVIASNHLVALLGQAERVAASAGVPLVAYLDLVRSTVDNVERLGAAQALTGPVARGDEGTLRRHLDALDPSERSGYEAGVALARRLLVPA